MNEETKVAIQLALTILKETLKDTDTSMAVTKDSGDLNFFDTATYLQAGEFKGFSVKIENLVK